MVLWADAIVEYNGIGGPQEGRGGGYEALDRFDPLYRRIYFWRGLTVTLSSAQKAVNALTIDPEFKRWLEAAPDLQKNYFEYKKLFDREMDRVNVIRNRTAAHIESHIGEALKDVPEDATGFMDQGGADVFRPRFALEFILAALTPDYSDATARAEKLKDLLDVVDRAFNGMVNALLVAVELYSRHYPLLPR